MDPASMFDTDPEKSDITKGLFRKGQSRILKMIFGGVLKSTSLLYTYK